MTACGCGCGQIVASPDAKGRPRRFARGHNLRVDSSAVAAAARRTWTGRKHTPETRARISEAMRGKERPNLRGDKNGMYGRTGAANPNYKDGSSPERQRLYARHAGRAFRRTILDRDGWRCTRCPNAYSGPRSLHVHHLMPWAGNPDLRFDPGNVITLCRPCHIEEHRRKEVKP